MKNIISLVALSGLVWSVTATAQDTGGGQISGKRQLVLCMNKQMAARHTLSYNEAARFCRERSKAQQTAAASAAPGNANTKPGS